MGEVQPLARIDMIRKSCGILISSAAIFLSTSANAAVLAHPNGIFEDVANGLLWTNGTISLGNLKSFAGANDWAANLVFGGVSDWRLPSKAEFSLLYETQSSNQTVGMIKAPFTVGNNYYWTSDVGTLSPPNGSLPAHIAFSPNGWLADSKFRAFSDTTVMDYWAVSSVPEPAAVSLFGLGLAGLAAYRRQRLS